MKARVSQLHKTEREWSELVDWIPEAGELVVYDPDELHDYARIKIGDGQTPLSKLAFFIDSAIAAFLQKCKYEEVIEAGRITEYNK